MVINQSDTFIWAEHSYSPGKRCHSNSVWKSDGSKVNWTDQLEVSDQQEVFGGSISAWNYSGGKPNPYVSWIMKLEYQQVPLEYKMANKIIFEKDCRTPVDRLKS